MTAKPLDYWLDALRKQWDVYRANGTREDFTEFTGTLGALSEHIREMRIPGLERLCASVETDILARPLNRGEDHPLKPEAAREIDRQVDTLLGAIAMTIRQDAEAQPDDFDPTRTNDWIKPRAVWMVVPKGSPWAKALSEQLAFYGFRVKSTHWGAPPPEGDAPFAVIFLPASDSGTADNISRVCLQQVARVRERCPGSQLFYVGVTRCLDSMVALMRAGIDITVQSDEKMSALLSRILDMVEVREQERYRVLVVEDSKVAMAQIKRALDNFGIDSMSISNPTGMLDAMDEYHPDLVLMDMYMPSCNGVEATRVLRQVPAYQATPIVYLSGETNVGLQVEALRLGGDQFMIKPFNPVLLATTVKTTVARHREMHRASRHDGLTGLLNHTATKTGLNQWIESGAERICVAMIDIDHFKAVNDTYGHPVGDQVIRSLGWLLKGRMRAVDLVGRYGGEEFLVAARDTDVEQMSAALDRIRIAFSNMPHGHPGGVLRCTFSAGLAVRTDPASTMSQLVAAADDALLQAKREGRNRLLLASGGV